VAEIIRAPQVNANDAEVSLTAWKDQPGARVEVGDVVCEVETTKAAVEVTAEAAGFVFPYVEPGASARVGDPLGWILEANDPKQAQALKDALSRPIDAAGPAISRKAQDAMARLGLTPADFAGFDTVRESDVEVRARSLAKGPYAQDPRVEQLTPSPQSLLIYGSGSQAVTVLDAVQAGAPFEVAAFIDFSPRSEELSGLPVIHAAHLEQLHGRGFRLAHICLPDHAQEARLAAELESLGFELTTVLHPTASVAPAARIGRNVFMGALTIVGPDAELADRVRVLNGASVAHHSKVGEGSRISDGARIAGNVTVGRDCLIGLNATVNLRLNVGDRVTVNSGANVYQHVPAGAAVRAG
jgi:sugar O-acyltransferase (sialic acid O-acetyltransferase NeuD family)